MKTLLTGRELPADPLIVIIEQWEVYELKVSSVSDVNGGRKKSVNVAVRILNHFGQ